MPDSKLYGLIGSSLKHSFSERFFTEKFKSENIQAVYRNIEIADTGELERFFKGSLPYSGLNVTFPYKESVIPFLDEVNENAREIGAVNVIEFRNGVKIGYNTDSSAFAESLRNTTLVKDKAALILGTGGASKAVAFALQYLEIPFEFVSRTKRDIPGFKSYEDIRNEGLSDYGLIVNCTPLGTYPDTEGVVDLNFDQVNDQHFLYDLVYNPELSTFLKKGLEKGARIKNGSNMLRFQAELTWLLWNR
ncbi:MAG TPA: shikimate dehydrogenase [Flavobacteriales bacterium]|nr:shikimate dehydrogenase [Flavobacteriales bacterium]